MEKLRTLILKIFYPFIKWMGNIIMPFSHKRAIEDYYFMLSVIKPLDVVLTNTKGHFSNIFNPGEWKHALIYIGVEDGIPMIVEAIGKGVIKRPLVECISEKDKVAVVRLNCKKLNISKGIEFANSHVGKCYDFGFDMDGNNKYDNFYCSELAFFTWKEACPEMNFVLKKSLGMITVIPDNFYKAHTKGKTTIVFKTPEKRKEKFKCKKVKTK